VTRPSYDPMRAPAPRFPRGRFARIHDDDTVAALAEAYEALSYEERVRFAHRVTSAPDELLRSIADELAQADQEQPPVEPVPAGAPEAPAVNMAAAQVNPDATPPPPGTPAEGAGEPVPGVATPDPATTAGVDTAPTQEQPTGTAPAAQPAPEEQPAPAPVPPPLPVPPEHLPQLPAAQLRTLAANVGVDTSGNKQTLAARIADAVSGEQPAVTPEQVAADAAQQQPAEEAPTPDAAPAAGEQPTPEPAPTAPDAEQPTGTPGAGDPGTPAPPPSAPETAPEPAPGPDTPAPSPAPTEGAQEAPQTPAAAADGTTTEGTAP
jgi:hypothetical protein